MRRFTLLLSGLTLVAAAAACGGKPTSTTTPRSDSSGSDSPTETSAAADAPPADDPATPFAEPAIRAALYALPANQTECAGHGSIADYVAGLRAQNAQLGRVQQSFSCRHEYDDRWTCTVSVWAEAPPEPAPANPCDGEPCGGDTPTDQVIVRVHPDGTFAPADVVCIAAG